MRLNSIKNFLQAEATSGVILIIAAILALILSNSPVAHLYQAVLIQPVALHIMHWQLQGTVFFLIDEGLMTLFFVLVGLELKRELLMGELAQPSRVVLPAVAALGGMVVPALIFFGMNYADPLGFKGWAVPVATDIAFALGVLSLFGKRVPLGLKLFLMTLAIFDDVGAIVIIAVFHTHSLSYQSMLGAAVCLFVLWKMNQWRIQSAWLYIVVGFILWVCVLQSGVHATVSGVLFAWLIPVHKRAGKEALLQRFERMLNPWVAYFILPLFALTNAGLPLGSGITDQLSHTMTLGVVLGLLLGKQIGVFGFASVLIRLKWAKLPAKTTWLELYGVAVLCGIGFTMSLFLGTLAFEFDDPVNLIRIRLGVLIGSFLSGIVGAIILRYAFQRNKRGLSI